MLVEARARHIRQSARKIRLVTTAVKAMAPADALSQLKLMQKAAAKPVADVLQSAVANATNNFKLNQDNLRILTLEVGDGATAKRFQARSRGQANPLMRRTAHIRVVLTDEPAPIKKGDHARLPAKPVKRVKKAKNEKVEE